MASEKSDKISNEEEDGDLEDKSLSSDYLMISGSTSSTIRSDVTFSQPYLSVRGSDYTGMDTLSFLSVTDPETNSDNVSMMFDFLDLEDDLADSNKCKDKPDTNGNKFCSNCLVDGKQTNATHFCKSCKPDGRYICHKCLQSHNRWSQDHFVVSLSVEEESYGRYKRQNSKDSNKLITSYEGTMNYDNEKDPNVVEPEPDRSGTLNHPKIRRLRAGFVDYKKAREINERRDRSRFYDDKLYREILQSQRHKKPMETTDGSFTKYGTYIVRSDADTKFCFVTCICQLQDGRLVLTDSENCRIKILDQNVFQVTASRKLQSSPCLISYMKENKVAVAFANCEVAIVEILNEIEIRSSFKIQHMCKGLSYGNGNLYVCSTHMIEIYSETGDRKALLRPVSTDVEIKCPTNIILGKNGNIIYVSDKEKGIVVMDLEGHILNIISDNIYEPNVLCLDVSGKIFATEINSGRVVKVDPDTGNVKQVIREFVKKIFQYLCVMREYPTVLLWVFGGVTTSTYLHALKTSVYLNVGSNIYIT